MAHAETVHALSHFNALGEVQDTAENLKAAIAGESYEVTQMYPDFIAAAEREDAGRKPLNSLRWAWEVEKVHEALYRQALETLGAANEEFDYYVCPVCGYTSEGSAPEKCPVCNAPGSRFECIH